MSNQPKRYVVQKHVMAASVAEALAKEPETPVQSVFPDTAPDNNGNQADAVGFKYIPNTFPYEY